MAAAQPIEFLARPQRVEGVARVLLVSTYELGHQPLALAAAAAALRGGGHEVRTLDLAVEPAPALAFRDADLVAISVPMHTATRLGLDVARAARRANPAARVAFFGLYAQPLAEHLIGPEAADEVVGGEYEPGLAALADRVAGRAAAALAPGIPRQHYAVPDRRGLPALERYGRVRRADGEQVAGYVEASRGCAHTCTHCPITPVYGGALRLVQREVALADITQQVEAGAQHITFGDPDFLNAVPHSLAIVEALHERWPALTYDATIKVEHLLEHASVLPRLRETGCLFVTSAFESCNGEILRRLEKGHTRADMDRALGLAAAATLPVLPTWVAFTPWTALEDYLDILDFVATHRMQRSVQPVQYTLRLLVPPGSPLVEVLRREGRLGPFDAEHLTYSWASEDPRVDALQREIAALVEAASSVEAQGCACGDPGCADASEPPDAAAVFDAVREAAYAAAGRPRPAPSAHQAPSFVPGLTESWYCCAEPTERQRAILGL